MSLKQYECKNSSKFGWRSILLLFSVLKGSWLLGRRIYPIILFARIRKISKDFDVLGDELKLSILVMKIPIANFIILLLNLLTKTINVQGVFWLFTAVNLLFYLVPIVNLYLFVRFMKQYPATIYYFTWLIRKKKEKNLLASRYVEM